MNISGIFGEHLINGHIVDMRLFTENPGIDFKILVESHSMTQTDIVNLPDGDMRIIERKEKGLRKIFHMNGLKQGLTVFSVVSSFFISSFMLVLLYLAR